MDTMLLQTQEWLNETYHSRTGYVDVPEDGGEATNSRYLTYRGLVRALQIELGGLTVDGDYGNGTVTRFNNIYPNGYGQSSTPTNMGYILQGTLWTKGYEPGGFTGIFGTNTANAIKRFQADAGIAQDGIVRGYLFQGLMNTDDYGYSGPTSGDEYYKHLVQLTLNQLYWQQIGLISPNGLWERKSHMNLIKACQIEWLQTPDGVFGTATMNAAPVLSRNTSGYTASKRLLQMALTVNGYYPGGFTGTFGDGTYNAVYNFQAFARLGADGVAGKNTWASLLKSCGNPDRTGATTCDTAVRLTEQQTAYVVSSGYNTVGRYLTNAGDPAQGYLDKKMTAEEIGILANAGLKVFPIYQTMGSSLSYFTTPQGTIDGIAAQQAAYRLGFPDVGDSTVIYFAVDYDVRNTEIDSAIVPYFRAVKSQIGSYKVGVYGPRSVCIALDEAGISEACFVCDMSSGFEGNIGYKLPDNWAYDQIAETYVAGYIGVDKCIPSPRATAIGASSLHPIPTPEEPVNNFSTFEQLYNAAVEYIGTGATIHDANIKVFDFFRQDKYVSGNWSSTAGDIDRDFCNWVNNQKGIFLVSGSNPANKWLIEPAKNEIADVEHMCATYASLEYVSLFDDEANDLAGWAGDLIQLGNVVANTKTHLNHDYWTSENLEKFIGCIDSDVDGFSFYDASAPNGTITGANATGYSWLDFCADVDAYNMHKNYNISETPIYQILEDYFNTNSVWLNRVHNFNEKLMAEKTGYANLSDVAFAYTNDGTLLTMLFGVEYDTSQYARLLADAFKTKIEYLIEQENSH